MSETNVTQSEYMTVAEVADALGVCRQTVYRMCRVGRLPHIRTGLTDTTGGYRVHRSAVDKLGATPSSAPAEPIPGQTEIPT